MLTFTVRYVGTGTCDMYFCTFREKKSVSVAFSVGIICGGWQLFKPEYLMHDMRSATLCSKHPVFNSGTDKETLPSRVHMTI